MPFRLKLPSQTSYYNRLDAAVLYVNKRLYQMTAIVADEIYEQVQNLLWPGAPMFTKPLRPGLALAEDPGTERVLACIAVASLLKVFATPMKHVYTAPTPSPKLKLSFTETGCGWSTRT